MIGNFEIQRPSLSLNVKKVNFSDLTGFRSVFLLTPTKTFTVTQSLVLSNWVNGVATKSIFPIHNIKDSINESEEPVLLESKLNYRYQARQGKYRFTIMVNCDVDYYIMLKKYEGQNLKVIFGDRNGNLVTIKDGTTIKPFTVNSIMVKKIGLGTFAQSSLVAITIDLANPSEMLLGYTYKPTFNINEIVNEEVVISEVTAIDTTTVQFKVTNGCSELISTLVATDFTLIDDISGTLTLHTFTNVGSGVYRYKSTAQQYLGVINLVSTKYNGSATYEFLEPEFNPLQFSSDFKIS